MVTFSLSLPPSNREPNDPILAADHNETVIALGDLSQQAASEVTSLHGALEGKVDDTDPRLSNPRTPTDHTHPVSELETYGVRDGSTFLRGDGTWATPPADGGVSDHGSLTGLGDDDHPQYLNVERGDNRYVRSVNGASPDANGEVTIEDPPAPSWGEVTGKPSTFPAEAHDHDGRYYTQAQVDDLLADRYTKAEVDSIVADLYAAIDTPPPSEGRAGLVAGEYRPDASTTGCPSNLSLTTYDVTELVIDESFVTNNGGRNGEDGRFTFERFDIPDGRLTVTAPDVTVREGRVHVATETADRSPVVDWDSSGSTGGLLEDVTISVASGVAIESGIRGTGVTVSRVDSSGAVDGFKLWDSSSLLGSWAHDLQHFDPDPWGQHSDGTHPDGAQFEGVGACEAIGNVLTTPAEAPSAQALIFTQNVGAYSSVVVRDNWLTGGGSAVAHFNEKSHPPFPLVFTGNVVAKAGASRHVISDTGTWNNATVSGNTGDGGSLDVWLNA